MSIVIDPDLVIRCGNHLMRLVKGGRYPHIQRCDRCGVVIHADDLFVDCAAGPVES